jgi:hypothetical protein
MAVLLGEIEVPSGILLVLDPGLGRFWRHDGDPRSPRKTDPKDYDLAIVGPDAVAAGKAYDRQFDPRYLFDVGDVAATKKHFAKFVKDRKLDARLERFEHRIPHLERARLAVEAGGGAGVVHYNNLWAVVVGGVPPKRTLRIEATPMPQGEFAGRWRSIDVVIDTKGVVAQSLPVQGVMVEHGQLICADLEAFGQFRMWESSDGLADFVFWGKDAPTIAKKFHAPQLDEHNFGWLNVPDADIFHRFGQPVQEWINSQKLYAGVDYRPHCNLEKLNAQIRDNELESGQLDLAGVRACGFSNRWGDGIFTVIRDLDAEGKLVRVRLDVGNEETQTRLRRVWILSCGAVATRKVLDGEPIRFAERLEPHNPDDSGWALSSGTETQTYMDNHKNLSIVQLSAMVQMDPELGKIIDAPVGSVFRRTKSGYVPDERILE